MRTAYEATSQRLRWTYSYEELETVRQELSDRAVEQCRRHWDTEAVRTDQTSITHIVR
jgi:hypothetical protein